MDDAARAWRVAKDGEKTRVRLCGSGRLLRLARELGGVRVGASPCTTSGGEPHEGSEAVGRERVQRTLASPRSPARSGKGPGTPPTAPPPAAPDAQTRPFPDPAAARVTTPLPRTRQPRECRPARGHRWVPCSRSNSRSSPSTGTSSPSDARSSSAMSTRGARVAFERPVLGDFPQAPPTSRVARFHPSCRDHDDSSMMCKPNPTFATFFLPRPSGGAGAGRGIARTAAGDRSRRG